MAPPAQWVRWGLVSPGVTWTLDKAVYGLRESLAWWSAERDKQLQRLCWTDPDTKKSFHLKRSAIDSQVWFIQSESESDKEIYGVLLVYVDEFLLQMHLGTLRTLFLDSLGALWTLAKEAQLTIDNPVTF